MYDEKSAFLIVFKRFSLFLTMCKHAFAGRNTQQVPANTIKVNLTFNATFPLKIILEVHLNDQGALVVSRAVVDKH